MKKYTNSELKKILTDINGGAVYVGIKDGHSVGDIVGGYGYIHFRHYGQTASKNIFAHFKEVLYIMFSDCDDIAPGVWSWDDIQYIAKDNAKILEG